MSKLCNNIYYYFFYRVLSTDITEHFKKGFQILPLSQSNLVQFCLTRIFLTEEYFTSNTESQCLLFVCLGNFWKWLKSMRKSILRKLHFDIRLLGPWSLNMKYGPQMTHDTSSSIPASSPNSISESHSIRHTWTCCFCQDMLSNYQVEVGRRVRNHAFRTSKMTFLTLPFQVSKPYNFKNNFSWRILTWWNYNVPNLCSAAAKKTHTLPL